MRHRSSYLEGHGIHISPGKTDILSLLSKLGLRSFWNAGATRRYPCQIAGG
jgi:hypothetical protein